MGKRVVCVYLLILILALSACGKNPIREDALQSNVQEGDVQELNIETGMEEVPFAQHIVLEEEQDITVMDINQNYILYKIWHWNDSGFYALMDKIGVWDMEKQEIAEEIDMEQQFLFSAKLDKDNKIYISCFDPTEGKTQEWSVLYWDKNEWKEVMNGYSSSEDGMNSPSLIRVGDEIVCVYENLVEESTYCFGSKLLKDGNTIDLEETEGDLLIEADYHFQDANNERAGSNFFVYFVEKNEKGVFRVVDLEGNILEFELSGKIYDYIVTDTFLIVSGTDEENGKRFYTIYDLNSNQMERYGTLKNGDRYRLCSDGKDGVISVDNSYGLQYAVITEDKLTEYPIKVMQDLEKAAVYFEPDGKGGFYFVYSLRYSGNQTDVYHVGAEAFEQLAE